MVNTHLTSAIPLLSLLGSAVLFGKAFHSPIRSYRRALYALFFVLVAGLSFLSSKQLWFSVELQSLWAQAVVLHILHIVSVLFIEQLSPALGCSEKTQEPYTWCQWIKATYRVWGNPQLRRLIRDGNDTGIRSSKQVNASFLCVRALKLPVHYYLQTVVLPAMFNAAIGEIRPEDVGFDKQSLFHSFTRRDLCIRAWVSLSWVLESVIALDTANILLSILFIGIGVDELEDWPPLFSSPAQATSLRNFWAKFWHKVGVRTYRNYGSLTSKIFGLRQETMCSKLIVAFVVFVVSGLSHAAVAWQAGAPDPWLEVWWFAMNFLACCAERVGLWCVRQVVKYTGLQKCLVAVEQSWLGRVCGYAWVVGFFFWSVPKWKYPRLERQAIAAARVRRLFPKLRKHGMK